jgi:Zn-dependent metalloprotease
MAVFKPKSMGDSTIKIVTSSIFFCLFLLNFLCGQGVNGSSNIYFSHSKIFYDRLSKTPISIRFVPNLQPPVDRFFDEYLKFFSISNNNQLLSHKTIHDRLGITHHRFNQYYKGIQVIGAQYVLHEKSGVVYYANGRLIHNLNLDINPLIDENTALKLALNYIGAESYMWENQRNEFFLKKEQKDPNATFYPKGELKIATGGNELLPEDFRLVYRYDIYAEKPLGRFYVDVDARHGDIVNKITRIHDTDVPGNGSSLYNGTVPITVDEVTASSNYRLQEHTTRAANTETYDMHNSSNYNVARDFTSSTANGPWDEAGVSAHFGAEATYDYYSNDHSRNSLDNGGFNLLSYVHANLIAMGYPNNNNAFWDGSRMTYGDGDGVNFTPLVSLDVVGHELTHGVTEFSANLIYQGESGALNEAYSDIFGNMVEFDVEGTPSIGTGSWRIGEDFSVSGLGFRNMENPNEFNDPDTYMGTFWASTGGGDPDYGGVHTNSGVLNFWFYLLSEGGIGTNDFGDSYDVTGIGHSKAAQIAYRNLTVYLIPSSDYYVCRIGAIDAATDLFGGSSPEIQAVTDAWDAVGVYEPIDPPEFEVSPTNLTIDIAEGGAISEVITISNIAVAGSDNLDWSIYDLELNLQLNNKNRLSTKIKPESSKYSNIINSKPIKGNQIKAGKSNLSSTRFSLSYLESLDAIERYYSSIQQLIMKLDKNYRMTVTFMSGLLYDNGALVNSPGTGSGGADESVLQNSSLGMGTLGVGHQIALNYRIADDFTIADPDGWYIDSLKFYAYQTGSSTNSTITAFHYQIWDGPPNNPTSSVVYGDLSTNRLISTKWSTIYRITETTPGNTNRPIMENKASAGVFLPSGTYWLEWQTDGSLASGPWAPPITVNGQTTTGNAIQWTGSWGLVLDVDQQGFPFLIFGTAATDCPWITENPIGGTISADSNQNIDLLVDGTGLPIGSYNCDIIINSNDSDEKQVTIPVSLTVSSNSVMTNLKIFLEGPYNSSGDTMRTDLRDNDFIPSTSPYAEDPDTVSSIPVDVTDWVLVQLRETATGPTISSKSVFLRKDGRIVADDGTSEQITFDVPQGDYYIVIKHSNHLAVMSADSIQLSSGSSTLYDFTSGTGQYYGSDAKQLEANVYGMYKGDANGNSFVNSMAITTVIAI